MRYINQLILTFTLLTLCGCSTLKNKTLLYGAVGFVGCSIIGASNAPKDESTTMHGVAYGSICAAGGMAAKEFHSLLTNEKSKKRLNQLRSKEVLKEQEIRTSLIESKAYESLDDSIKRGLMGKWRIYETKNWVFDGEKMIREDVHVEFDDENKK